MAASIDSASAAGGNKFGRQARGGAADRPPIIGGGGRLRAKSWRWRTGDQLVVSGKHSVSLMLDERRKHKIVERDGVEQIDTPSIEDLRSVFAEFIEDHVRRLDREHLILASDVFD
ncbi:MAG: hypothetical protein U1A72_17925, partial [Sulfuritalea sp.]|nr:hypothetical protein [Sulfuritalea sp.]